MRPHGAEVTVLKDGQSDLRGPPLPPDRRDLGCRLVPPAVVTWIVNLKKTLSATASGLRSKTVEKNAAKSKGEQLKKSTDKFGCSINLGIKRGC